MRSARTILVVVGCTMMLAGAVGADQTSETRKAISALYRRRTAAFVRKDVDGVFADCTPDCVITTDGKQHSLTQERENLKRMYQAMQDIKSTTTIQQMRVTGNTSIITAIHHASAKLLIPQTRAKKQLVATEVDRETWIKTSKGWREKYNQEMSLQMTLDGKPFKQ